jgi:hypothetical protein
MLPFQECWSFCIIHILLNATLTMSATNMKQHINSFLNPTNLPVSTFDSLTWHPPPLLPVCPLVVFANTLDSLLLQLMKATVLAKSSLFIYFHQALSAPVMSTDISQKGGRSHPSFLKYFY